MVESPIPVERDLYIANLKTISETLNNYGVLYSVVGGIAVRAILGKDVEYRRKNRTIPDFDAQALQTSPHIIKEANNKFKELHKKNSMFPSVGLDSATLGTWKPNRNPFSLLSGLHIDNNRYFLTFRDLKVEIPSETVQTRQVSYGGVAFSCFPSKTIWIRHLTRGASFLKKKDLVKLEELYRHIGLHHEDEPPDEMYTPYMEFVLKAIEKYPFVTDFYNFWWLFDSAVGGFFSGQEGFIYDLIEKFK